MDWIWQIQIGITLFFQNMGAWLVSPMKFFSFFGTSEAYLLIMPLIYWCVDTTLGLRIAVMLMLTQGLNGILKLVFHTPRPYWFDTSVQGFASESSYGMPSGHSQNSVSIFGLLSLKLKRNWAIFTWIFILLIGLSRIYLGVHFTTDVLTGWAVGLLLLWAFVKFEKPVSEWLKKLSFWQLILFNVGMVILLILILLGINAANAGWQMPEFWKTNALLAFPETPINPASTSDFITLAGIWLGLSVGAAWMKFYGGGILLKKGTAQQNILRYIIGMIGVMLIWSVLGQILPRTDDVAGAIFRLLRYTLLGGWVSALAPSLFKKLKLV